MQKNLFTFAGETNCSEMENKEINWLEPRYVIKKPFPGGSIPSGILTEKELITRFGINPEVDIVNEYFNKLEWWQGRHDEMPTYVVDTLFDNLVHKVKSWHPFFNSDGSMPRIAIMEDGSAFLEMFLIPITEDKYRRDMEIIMEHGVEYYKDMSFPKGNSSSGI